MTDAINTNAIAVVGMAGHFPGADDIKAYWSLLREGREATMWLSDADLRAAGVPESLLRDPAYVRAAMPLNHVEDFDAGFFGFSPREAAILDPQHRHFLECCWEALEHAGHRPSAFSGSIGVFGGCGPQAYYARNLLPNAELVQSVGHFLLRHTGNDKDFLTTRASYLFDLKGPSIAVQTACSTSLVAVHMAAQSLLAGECDMALAGGASIEIPHRQGYLAADGEILSPTGHCAAFDDHAAGTVFGSGAGIVVLRRLADAIADGDTIHAVILGSAVNNDGAGKAGYFAPSVEGQVRAASEAIAIAGIDPESVGYIEAHGTGTVIGDPIELAALNEAYAGSATRGSIGIGSVKTNIGHLDTAAGVASLIKTILALQNATLPASLNITKPNTRFDFASSPFSIVDATRPWPRTDTPRRAGVNSLGVGGTNAHVILEEAPAADPGRDTPQADKPCLITLSAKSQASLDALVSKWRAYARDIEPGAMLADAAYTTQVGREPFSHRLAVVARSGPDLALALSNPRALRLATATATSTPPDVVFMFPGGGAQYPGCARDLYRSNPVFRAAADECFALLPPAASHLPGLMVGDASSLPDAGERLEHPLLSILAVFIVEVALTRMWQAQGIKPAAVIANSAGDYAAAVAAGVMSLKDALTIVALRGDIFARMQPGAMLSVHLPEAQLRARAGTELDIAVISAPDLGVVSGSIDAIDRLHARLDREGIECSRVRIGVAAHSRMLEPYLNTFRERLETMRFSPPTLPFMSCVTGRWATPEEMTSPEYWVRHLRHTVRFGDALTAILSEPGRLLLEVGPGKSLSPLAMLCANRAPHKPVAIVASTRAAIENDSDIAIALSAAGRMWVHGVTIDFTAMRNGRRYRRIPVPTYAFDRQRHWIDAPRPARGSPIAIQESTPTVPRPQIRRMTDIDQWIQKPVWQERPLQQTAGPATAPARSILVFSDRSHLAQSIISRLKRTGELAAIVEMGATFSAEDPATIRLDPLNGAHYAELIDVLVARGAMPQTLLHMWSLAATATPARVDTGRFSLAFDSVYSLLRAAQLADAGAGLRLVCVTTGAVTATGEPVTRPENATLLGPVRVWPRESAGGHARLIDILASGVDDDRLAEQILAELSDNSSTSVVALRNDRRYVELFSTVTTSLAPATRIVRDGVYLITGGTGALGLELAKYLTHTHQARLALVSRSGAATPLPDGLRDRAIVLPADVTDETAMARAINATRAHFGRLDGVIHAAGVIADAPIGAKTLAEAQVVLAPKITGARILDRLLPPGTISLFAVFSSTSAILGPPGQADYAAANAYLQTLAQSRSDGLAIDWGIWSDIGMAARRATRTGASENDAINDATAHPLLGRRTSTTDSAYRFETIADPSRYWVLDEHRVADNAVLPGTAYLEMARAAMSQIEPGSAYELTRAAFHLPLVVAPGAQRKVTIDVRNVGTQLWHIEISGSNLDGNDVDRLFTVDAAQLDATPPRQPRVRTGRHQVTSDQMAQTNTIAFGPRWHVVKSVTSDSTSVEALLELDAAYRTDLDHYALHPALLDVAMTIGLHLAPAAERNETLFVPAAIARVEAYAPLPARIMARARVVSHEPKRAMTFDVELLSPDGRCLVIIEGLEMRAVSPATFAATVGAVPVHTDSDPIAVLLAAGLRKREAGKLFDLVFASMGERIVVSSISLNEIDRFYAARAPQNRIVTTGPPETPRDGLTPSERLVADLFADILGLTDVRLDDEFLERGGHSLAAVRLFARIRKQTGLDLGIATIFAAPSVRGLAQLIDERSRQAASSSEPRPVAPRAVAPSNVSPLRGHSAAWSPIVRISAGEAGNLPLFWVHGAAGNVVSIAPLAEHLRKTHPLYGIQAHGVDGRKPPQEKIEDMASSYIAAIREVQPEGPYCLLGYSGGGVIAYEMAQQLRAMGQEIALLAMIDTLAPSSARGTRISDWLAYGWRRGLPALAHQARNGLKMRIGNLVKRWFPAERNGRDVDPIIANADKVFASYLRAQSRYFTLPSPGSILLFRAKDAGVAFSAAGRMLGWDAHVDDRVTVYDIEANHDSIVLKPGIDEIALILDQRLLALNDARRSEPMPAAPARPLLTAEAGE
jgi:acyl transferase domain-containing protein/thioesterase domain-containing protein